MRLTIGMATYGNVDDIFYTVQALRLYHKQSLDNAEILIIDNKGNKIIEDWINAWGHKQIRYEKYLDCQGTSQPRNRVFECARGEYVLCIDSHVFLPVGALNNITNYMDNGDLIQGPLFYDSLDCCSTHMEPIWRDGMYGIWSDSIQLKLLSMQPKEIYMQGLGLFGCRKDAWLKFNNKFRGFGGEEGYIHEKYKQANKKVLCLPWLLWNHKFINNGPTYEVNLEDRIHNYIIGFTELNMDLAPIYKHFGTNIVNAVIKINNLSIKKRPNEIYSYIYKTATKGGLYGAAFRREPIFFKYIKEQFPNKNIKILDASCGRGYLIRWLNSAGYKADGTEIADSLFEKGGDLYGMPVIKREYNEFNKYSDNEYDVIISNDVLEHLNNEEEIEKVLQQFNRISSQYILISTGGWRQAACPFPELNLHGLHNIIKPKEWWINICKKYFDVFFETEAAGSIFIFGKSKKQRVGQKLFKTITFPLYPLSTTVGRLYKNVSKETLAPFTDIIVSDAKIESSWNLAWGEKKDFNAVMETGFFWEAMHIDIKGLYQNSSLNIGWEEIEKFEAPKSAKEIILNQKHTSKYSQTNKNILWKGVVLALQNPYDRSVKSCGSSEDYFNFIEKACSVHTKNLFLKLHPWNNGEIEEKIRSIAKRYNCLCDKTNHSVIENCDFVLTYNSTFAVDCFIRGVPVAQVAPGYWDKLPCVLNTDFAIPTSFKNKEKFIQAGYRLADFLVWRYCFNMDMPIEKWVKMLRYFASSKELFPMTDEFCYANNI